MKQLPEKPQSPWPDEPQRKRAREETNDTNSSLVSNQYHAVGRYKFLETLGHGACGTVYKAEDRRTKRTVAIKMMKYSAGLTSINPTDINEVIILRLVHHENVVEMYDVFFKRKEAREIGIVMEYMDFSLRSFMNTIKSRFTECQARYLVHQLLCGMKYLHRVGVIHRDLKLSNLLLDRKGLLKIADFGSSCICGKGFLSQGEKFGTTWYRAPEILLGALSYSSKVDMWSVGCIFAFLILRRPLFDGKDDEDQIEKIFQIVGTPTETSWPGVIRLPGMQKYLSSPSSHPGCLWDKFKGINTSKEGLKLLESLLQLPPSKRISAKDAVENEYFKEAFTLNDRTAFAEWMNSKLAEREEKEKEKKQKKE